MVVKMVVKQAVVDYGDGDSRHLHHFLSCQKRLSSLREKVFFVFIRKRKWCTGEAPSEPVHLENVVFRSAASWPR